MAAKKEKKELVRFRYRNHPRTGQIVFTAETGITPHLVVWKEGSEYRSAWLRESQIERLSE